ncbi:hypothetical protein KPH14_010738 [Odynerus spinipes]|uniref:Uncharacterized protein n=1 Tax=Odynerus spinipes TaxID=1348599 RepID=A0AAD9RV72_9HYME|nr:hypothetical protein KPH14_010738 [Odynerus spinipes]
MSLVTWSFFKASPIRIATLHFLLLANFSTAGSAPSKVRKSWMGNRQSISYISVENPEFVHLHWHSAGKSFGLEEG